MPPSYLLLFLLLLHSVHASIPPSTPASLPAEETLTQLSSYDMDDISCVMGFCAVAEGCEGNPVWRRVLEWPVWKEKPSDCQHAFMIRRNIDPGHSEKRKENGDEDIQTVLDKRGQEYFIVMASGGPEGPAREMRLEDSMLHPIFGVTHDTLNKFGTKKKREHRWTIDSYDYQTLNGSLFEAGVLVRIKGNKEGTLPLSEKWDDFCVFIHSSRSMQHLCGGLERIFQRIPSQQFPMKHQDCQDDLSDPSIELDQNTGFFKCMDRSDDVIKIKLDNSDQYVRLHYAFCLAGKTMYLVEHPTKRFLSLKFDSAHIVKCGDDSNKSERCPVPPVPPNVTEYCGVRCEMAGKTPSPDGALKPHVLRCDFLNAVIDDKVYRKGEAVPVVECDPTGWWRYSEAGKGGIYSKWITSMYCFYPQSDVYSDCVLDRFECNKYGDCPIHRHHQVDCDGNTEGLVLAVFHQGLENGFTRVNKLGCDTKNGWWTVNGKSLPKTAIVDCVWPFELEIMKRAAKLDEWEPKEELKARALSEIGPSVRTASLIVAVISFAAMIAVVVIAKVRLEGPKTRMVTRHLRALYPSLLNEEERLDAAKAEKEYRNVDCEAAGLALHQIHKLLQEQEGENKEKEKEKEIPLHTHWISLSWPKQNLLLERALLHRAFFCLKVLYDKFTLPAEPGKEPQPFEEVRPGLREKILKVSMEYKAFIENWTPNEFLYSLAFATLTKAELDAFRRNVVTRKNLRHKPQKEVSVISTLMNEGVGVDPSTNKAETADAAAVAPAVETPPAEIPAAAAAANPGDKIEETTAPPAQKE